MKYDVVIRCRNEIEWLPRVINSLIAQSIPPEKIILVDNGSSDGSLEFAQNLQCTIVHYDKKQFNFSHALNLGFQEVSQPYTLVLSAHCELASEDSAEILLKTIIEFNAAAVFGRQLPTVHSNAIDTRDLLTVFGRERIIYKEHPFFHNAFSLVESDAWSKMNFDTAYNGIEDRVWARYQAQQGRLIVYEPRAMVYHEHGLNQGATIHRAKRVCNALKALHSDDCFEWPKL